jgi:branched-subunit amino acid ABC-type transport system permease component
LHQFWLAVGFGLVTASVIALGAVGITLQFGVTNYVNFAYGALMTLGAYFSWEFVHTYHWNVWWTLLPIALAVGVIACLMEKYLLGPFSRRVPKMLYMIIVTFGISTIMLNIIIAIWNTPPRVFRLETGRLKHIGPFQLTNSQFIIIALSVGVMLALYVLLVHTRIGKAMRAVSDSQALAASSGINIRAITFLAFFISGALAGVAGVVLATNQAVLTPNAGDGLLWMLFAAVILGGIGNPVGAVVGALFIGEASEISAIWINPAYKTDIVFLVIPLVLLLRPQGVFAARGRH